MTEPPQITDVQAPADRTLVELAARYGIAVEFTDWKGRNAQVPASTLTAVLAALDVDASTPLAAQAALEEHTSEHWRRMLPPCVVSHQNDAHTFEVHVSAGAPVRVTIELEDGGVREAYQVDNWEPDREIDDHQIGEASFATPIDLPLGYHEILAESGEQTARTPLIVTPYALTAPASLHGRRTWGLATQLYSVRSQRSWGIGDLSDLGELAVWSTSEHDAGYVLVNPLHAAEPTPPMEPSPYLPVSRRYFNPIYLRVENIEEYAYLASDARKKVRSLGQRVQQKLAKVDAIDRDQVWKAKSKALRIVYAAGRSAGRQLAFEAYQRREGRGLIDFATWCALYERYGKGWQEWPAPYQRPTSREVNTFRKENAEDIGFYCWLQWCLDEQLRGVQSAATDAGMALGIVHDLAVGVHPGGADVWSMSDAYANDMHVGAPPDQFTQLGQDWGQPPWRPDRLAELAYQPFRAMVAGILRHAGGVRIDHIIGLFRLWWVPAGKSPVEGTYVRYDHRAMIGILALEAHRAGAVVVGEDLGTVEPSAREFLRARGMLGTSILWFEQDWSAPGGSPLRPEQWREYCMASVTTHDLPPTLGYLAGDHVRLRHRLGLLTDTLEQELAHDREEREQWLAMLRSLDLLAADEESPDAVLKALHAYITQTPSMMLNLALTDAVGDRRTQNQPGTIDEYPNWRVPLTGPAGEPLSLEDVFASKLAARLCEMMRA